MEILEVTTQDSGGHVTVSLKGELDLSSVGKVEEELERVEKDGPAVLVLDLSQLSFLDSTGLGVMVGALKRVRTNNGELALVCSESRILKVFEITGLTKVFPMHRTLADVAAPG